MGVNFIARQPVLDKKLNTWGYELLFRSGMANVFAVDGKSYDGDKATMSVINNELLDNITSLGHGAKSLINFTRSLLLDEYALLLPKETVIVEILEDVKPDEEILQVCKKLKSKGYTIALDDFFYSNDYVELLKLADIIKLDFMAYNREEIEEMVKELKPYNVTLLAEKVESTEDFEYAKKIGCVLFQGYFFCKPIMVKREQVPESKLSKLRLISEVNSRAFVISNIEEIFKTDPVLTLRLLKYLNSSFFSFRSKIKTIQQAIIMLGPKKLRRWTTVVAASDLSEGVPNELLKESLFRARFCELIGQNVINDESEEDFFMLGLLSYVDAFFGQPKEILLLDLPLVENVKNVLLGKGLDGLLSESLEIAQALEFGMWDYVDAISKVHQIDGKIIKKAYFDAVSQANDYMTLIG